MRVIFRDGVTKDQPFDVAKMAKLVRISQKHGGDIGFRVELNPNRSPEERQKQVKQVEDYIHWLDINNK